MLRIRGLTRAGLGPVDLDLEAGACAALAGPSGAGKSLLLRAISDLDPNDGQVSLDGTSRSSMPAPEWRRKVGYLAAESGWWEDTVGLHFSDAEGAAPLLSGLGLDPEALGWPIERLSTGEKQRLALARLLELEPPGPAPGRAHGGPGPGQPDGGGENHRRTPGRRGGGAHRHP